MRLALKIFSPPRSTALPPAPRPAIDRRFPGAVAAHAVGDLDQIPPARDGSERSRAGTGLSSGIACSARARSRSGESSRCGSGWRTGGQRAQVDDDRRQVLVGEGAKGPPPHLAAEAAAVVADPFADGAGELVVRPGTGAGLDVRRQVRRHQAVAGLLREDRPRELASRDRRRARPVAVTLGVADHATDRGGGEILAPRQPLGRRLEADAGECPLVQGLERRRRAPLAAGAGAATRTSSRADPTADGAHRNLLARTARPTLSTIRRPDAGDAGDGGRRGRARIGSLRHPMSLVSIVIPLFDTRPYVRRAVESALAQTHAEIEVIVVDDGSTDGGAEEIRDFVDGGRVRLIERANGGSRRRPQLRLAGEPGRASALPRQRRRDRSPTTSPGWSAPRPGRSAERRLLRLLSRGPARRDASGFRAAIAGSRRHLEGDLLPALASAISSSATACCWREPSSNGSAASTSASAHCEDYHLRLRLFAIGASARFVDEPLARYRSRPGSGSSDPDAHAALVRRGPGQRGGCPPGSVRRRAARDPRRGRLDPGVRPARRRRARAPLPRPRGVARGFAAFPGSRRGGRFQAPFRGRSGDRSALARCPPASRALPGPGARARTGARGPRRVSRRPRLIRAPRAPFRVQPPAPAAEKAPQKERPAPIAQTGRQAAQRRKGVLHAAQFLAT